MKYKSLKLKEIMKKQQQQHFPIDVNVDVVRKLSKKFSKLLRKNVHVA